MYLTSSRLCWKWTDLQRKIVSSAKKIIPGFRILTVRWQKELGKKGKRQNPQSCGVAIRHLQVPSSSEDSVFAEQSWGFMKYNHDHSDQKSTRRFLPLLILHFLFLLVTLVLGLGNAYVGTGVQNQTAASGIPSPVPAAKWVGIQRTQWLICTLCFSGGKLRSHAVYSDPSFCWYNSSFQDLILEFSTLLIFHKDPQVSNALWGCHNFQFNSMLGRDSFTSLPCTHVVDLTLLALFGHRVSV